MRIFRDAEALYLASDSDELLLIYIPFMQLLILVSWSLWKERNDRTFDRRVRTVDDLVMRVCDEVVAWSHAGYRHLESAFAASSVFSGRAIVTE